MVNTFFVHCDVQQFPKILTDAIVSDALSDYIWFISVYAWSMYVDMYAWMAVGGRTADGIVPAASLSPFLSLSMHIYALDMYAYIPSTRPAQ